MFLKEPLKDLTINGLYNKQGYSVQLPTLYAVTEWPKCEGIVPNTGVLNWKKVIYFLMDFIRFILTYMYACMYDFKM